MILVTGSTGFIGSHLIDRLVAGKRAVRCLVRRTSATRHLSEAGVELAYGDLSTGEGLPHALRGVDTIIHLAGVTKARAVSGYYAGNVESTVRLLGAATNVRRLVHVSSLSASGPSPPSRPLTEDDEPRPVSEYGKSKLAGEQAVRKSPLAGISVILRPPVVYGPRDRDVYEMIRTVSRGWIPQIGRTERRFSVIYVKDLAAALVAAADRADAGGKIFYVADPAPVSWLQFGRTAADLMGRTARSLAIPEGAAYAVASCAEWWTHVSGKPTVLTRDKVTDACCPAWICDPARARLELGFGASTTLEDGLRETLAWYREAGWLKF